MAGIRDPHAGGPHLDFRPLEVPGGRGMDGAFPDSDFFIRFRPSLLSFLPPVEILGTAKNEFAPLAGVVAAARLMESYGLTPHLKL